MIKDHVFELVSETSTFYGSHYSSDRNEVRVICSCGYKSNPVGYHDEFDRSEEYYIQEHKLDILAKATGLVFKRLNT